MKIRKAIIPAAGWGTRFLPQTKAMPKEMLPIVDKPVIQYVVEEIVASGIKNIIIVTNWQKRAIEDHFDRSFELEKFLESVGKIKELEEIKRISQLANFVYLRQKSGKYGNAIPILISEHVIGNEFFAVLWGDEFIMAKPPRLKQMLKVFEKFQGGVISMVELETEDQFSRYGIADVEPIEGNIYKIKKIVEKPGSKKAPSRIAAHGAYILPPEIFKVIKKLKPSKNGEYLLVDAINQLIKKGFPFYGCKIKNGKYYDAGNKLEYLKTLVEFGLNHPNLSHDFKEYLKKLQL